MVQLFILWGIGPDHMVQLFILWGIGPDHIVQLLAHLWGAYAIPLALSVVRRESSVSTITTRYN